MALHFLVANFLKIKGLPHVYNFLLMEKTINKYNNFESVLKIIKQAEKYIYAHLPGKAGIIDTF